MSENSFADYFDVGIKKYQQGEYEDAVEALLAAKFYAENDSERAMATNKIAWCWRYMGFKKIKDTSDCYQKAESYWRECLETLGSLSDRKSREMKVSVIKGLMLIFSKNQAEILYWACLGGLEKPGDLDLILDLDNSRAIMLKEDYPEEAAKLFEKIYIGAKELGNSVLAGHAAQNLGTILMQRYRRQLDTEGSDCERLAEAEIWLLKALLTYPEGESAHIGNTIKKIRDIVKESRENSTYQLRLLVDFDPFLKEEDLCLYCEVDYKEENYENKNVPIDLCDIVIEICSKCGGQSLWVHFK